MAEEVIRILDSYYIVSTSARIDDRTRVLKHDDTFAYFDRYGDIERFGTGEHGIYHQDTRFLSRLELLLEGKRPLMLGSTILDDNAGLSVDMTNPDIRREDGTGVPRGRLHLSRSKFLWQDVCHEQLKIHNYGSTTVDITLSIEAEADFVDIFEVRGLKRKRRGRLLPPEVMGATLMLSYEGLDEVVRRTALYFDPSPARLGESQAHYDMHLEPRGEKVFYLAISCELDNVQGKSKERITTRESVHPDPWYKKAEEEAEAARRKARAGDPIVTTSNEQFNEWWDRSVEDLHMLRTETEHGPYPYAGVPWFSTVFGRDGIITALEGLWFNPGIARGVLSYLADFQAEEDNAEQDAQPGKVLHEIRAGEMAAIGETPFCRYYGSVDATPLFVVLAGAYFERTGDRAFAAKIWPHVERALAWIDQYGDIDGDGFVEYSRRSPRGLDNQGWKDSHDAVFHADGSLAEPPIALCEVQGYTYAAKKAAAAMAASLDLDARAKDLASQADILQNRFEEAFWREDLSTYVMALDGSKKQCRVVTSNAGHCLYSGIASEDRARRVAATLLNGESYSGWGIRTVAVSEARHNPMSYHNGSIWPHDNAIIAAGFSRYGLKKEAAEVLQGLFDASVYLDLHRLPELFCGFKRRPGESPTQYPVSCSPQAWAAGAILMLIQACLGLEVKGSEKKLRFAKPLLPRFIDDLRIDNLSVGEASLDLSLTRHERDVGVNVLFKKGHADVVVVK